MNNEIYHYGTPHVGNVPHSGRYPYGSGERYKEGSYMEKMDFLARYDAYKKEGMNEKEIANAFGLSINDFRKKRSLANAEAEAARKTRAVRLKAKGYTNEKIGELMGGYSESTVRGWLKAADSLKKDKIQGVADVLEERLKKGEMLDVGLGAELSLGCTQTTLNTALKLLKDKGYFLDTLEVKQPLDPNKNTTVKYIAPPGTTRKMAWDNRDEIQPLTAFSPDKGINFNEAQPPTTIDDKRIHVVYRDEGGLDRDGLIGIRPGVKDISLGEATYAQVRIAVDKDGKPGYYIKGMAVYDDTIPAGKDIVVYSNKRTRYSDKANAVEGALKEAKNDPNNPFGATITAQGQNYFQKKDGRYIQTEPGVFKLDNGKLKAMDGKKYELSPVNILRETGTWDNYKKQLSSQFLSKQPLKLIKDQLDLTFKNKKAEYDEIMALTNPMVKQKLLNDFAGGCDSDAKTLAAAALPRQASKVLIPIPSLKDTEVYAPTYKNGEKIALIRHPHAGPFEIPILTVNNKNMEGKKVLGNAIDAIGITKKAADRLSGADFDGDHVITIPLSDKVRINARSPLKGLEDFDTQEAYPGYKGMKVMTSRQTGIQMGVITNLITDMSTQNPTESELARAVRHSMVIIDAEKHGLNWKQSEKDNGIDALKQKYQKNPEKAKGYGGASSLISRADAKVRVPELQMVNKEGKKTYTADKETGKIFMAPTGEGYIDKNGNKVLRKKEYSQMDLVDDARKLSNGSAPEEAYANYANKMKALANQSRKEALAIKTTPQDAQAKKTYATEVAKLTADLNVALKNKPLERQAQLKTSVKVSKLEETHPELFAPGAKKDKVKKEKAKILEETRHEVGAGKHQIDISEKEWEAIQAHAVSDTTLRKILANADMDRVRALATPKDTRVISDAKASRIRALSNSGFTIAEIAEMVGASASTVSKYMK